MTFLLISICGIQYLFKEEDDIFKQQADGGFDGFLSSAGQHRRSSFGRKTRISTNKAPLLCCCQQSRPDIYVYTYFLFSQVKSNPEWLGTPSTRRTCIISLISTPLEWAGLESCRYDSCIMAVWPLAPSSPRGLLVGVYKNPASSPHFNRPIFYGRIAMFRRRHN